MLKGMTNWLSGLWGKGGTQAAAGATAQAGSFLDSPGFRKGLASTMSFMSKNPGYTGMGIGAVGGYMSSGELGGAAFGAIAGGLGGRAGWGSYQQKTGRRQGGIGGALRSYSASSRLGDFRQRLSAKVGRQISQSAPDLAQSYGPSSFVKAGHARNLGGKRLGGQIVGAGMMLGAGVGGGMIYNTPSAIGNTFGGPRNTTYGTAFSGMGNGTITSY